MNLLISLVIMLVFKYKLKYNSVRVQICLSFIFNLQ